MNNFKFHNPVKIIFGKGEIRSIKKEIPADAKILMTCGGGSIKSNGVYDQVVKALRKHNYIEFWGIESNPHYETLMKAVEIVKKEGIDFLLAVGGGSVLDGTKFIAAASYFEGDPWDILDKSANIDKALPLGAVLTLPATGSEMNAGGVVTKWETKTKLPFGNSLLYPKFSVLDPETTYTLSKRQLANGIVDSFIHVTEQYLTYPVNSPIQDRFAEGILLTLIEEGKKYVESNDNYETAANVMWSATMALNGLIGAGVVADWATHIIGHELTALHDIDHGITLAIVLPGVLQFTRESKKEKLLQYAERVWGLNSGSDDERIDRAIQKTDDFFIQLGVKTRLSEYNVGMDTIEKIAERLETRGWDQLGENKDINPEKVREILKLRL